MNKTGKFYGVGVGPGDPELLTLKAVRIITAADIICYLKNTNGQSIARDIAANHISSKQREYPILMAMDKNRNQAATVYESSARDLTAFLDAGKSVAIICQGDPLFYGSFIYLYEHLAKNYICEIVPGITSINAAAAASKKPLSYLSDRVAVVSSRNDDLHIRNALSEFSSVAIMKAGPDRKRLLNLIDLSGRWQETVYIEKVTQAEEKVFYDLDDVPNSNGPYFSMFLTTRTA